MITHLNLIVTVRETVIQFAINSDSDSLSIPKFEFELKPDIDSLCLCAVLF